MIVSVLLTFIVVFDQLSVCLSINILKLLSFRCLENLLYQFLNMEMCLVIVLHQKYVVP